MSKSKSGIYFKCSQKQREQIKKNAKECGLKQGEYILQRALGYAPKEQQIGQYLDFYKKLCELTNLDLSQETDIKLTHLIDRIYARFFESTPPDEIRAQTGEN